MQQTEQTLRWSGVERRRVEAVVETLASVHSGSENLAGLAHDARNMVTALGLYCDLLEEPGVLATPYLHYGSELRLVAAASRRLVEKLVALDSKGDSESASWAVGLPNGALLSANPASGERARQVLRRDLLPAVPIDNLAGELLASRNLLAALAGPAIALTVETEGGALPVRLTGEDLTRVLVNLVKNSAEAMPAGGKIQLSLREVLTESGVRGGLLLTIEDNGPGIPKQSMARIFDAGFSTRTPALAGKGSSAAHRGLGLSISRSIVEAAGGGIQAVNRQPAGARIEVQLPVRAR